MAAPEGGDEMSAEVWFTRLTLKRDDAAIAPLLQELAPRMPARRWRPAIV